MAKYLRLTDTEINSIIEKIKAELIEKKTLGEIKLSQSLKDDRKAKMIFSQQAWIKINELVAQYSTEVEWHGLVERLNENTFKVYDIVVFPHQVTSSTVTSDQEEYTKWLESLDDDTFDALKYHGHSHVNMGVSPSSTDENYRKNLVTQLPKPTENNDVFYLFMIINKTHDITCEIYDFTNNALYETGDITLAIEGIALSGFMKEAKEKTAPVAKSSITTYSKSGTSSYVDTDKGLKKIETEKEKDKPKKRGHLYDDYYDDDDFFGDERGYGRGYYGYGGYYR